MTHTLSHALNTALFSPVLPSKALFKHVELSEYSQEMGSWTGLEVMSSQ